VGRHTRIVGAISKSRLAALVPRYLYERVLCEFL
jgi:hypothetical protein